MPRKLFETKHEFNLCSIEWCPQYFDYLALGAYEMAPGSSYRAGGTMLFKWDGSTLTEIQRASTGGILDSKWHGDLLGTADSNGSLNLYQISPDGKLSVICSSQMGGMALSLDWRGTDVAISSSEGDLHLLKLAEGGIALEKTIKAHSFEAWIASYDYWSPNVVYSGGDDNLLKVWDTRTGLAGVTKKHEMGVTSIRSNHVKEYVLATGSYDEKVSLWDTRNWKNKLGEVKTGGGVWRLKWEPSKAQYLLAACMHGGFQVIDCKDLQNLDVAFLYKEHTSLAYGADWKFNGDGVSETVATCSFYDNMLHVWNWREQ